ncbi:MAG: DUF924 family protein [Ostreibacterium sp.]
MNNLAVNYNTIINFWFTEIQPAAWFKKDEAFDQLISDRFISTYYAAAHGELCHWRDYPQGRLAEIIVLDQFSRNIFRDSAQAFQTDNLAVILTQEAIKAKADKALSSTEKAFLYMPLMHSESLIIHQQAVEVFAQQGLESNYQFELKHQVIIKKFGRYPHRNKILKRTSTAEELAFLNEPNSSF